VPLPNKLSGWRHPSSCNRGDNNQHLNIRSIVNQDNDNTGKSEIQMKSNKSPKRHAAMNRTATNDNELHDGVLTGATPQPSKLSKQQRNDLFQRCATLAKTEDILATFVETIRANGLAGQERAAAIIFLAMISRLLPRPVSILVKGSSGGGKNTLVSAVLRFFAPEAYHEMTGMSEKALAYFREPLKNRMLIVTEAAGLQGNDGLVFLRCLLSEGFLKYMVTVGKQAVLVEVEGPTGVILTTTSLKLYHDDETRLISTEITESPAQTRKVFELIGKQEETGDRSIGEPSPEWHALMRWIAAKPRLVVNPYAGSIMTLIPSNAPPRIFRDVKATFGLIASHALLHQRTRKKREDGAIIATLDDYKAVRRLVKDIIAEGIDAAVSPGVRRVVEAVTKLTKAHPHLSGKQLVDEIGVHKTTVSRDVAAAIGAGYVRDVKDDKKRSAKYVLGDPMPLDNAVLPSAKAVAKEYRKRESKKEK
jgi:hypothetical protein